METALLVISFGTTHQDTLKKAIVATENALVAGFPELRLYRAFTSRVIRSRLKKQYGIAVDDVPEALGRIARDGFTHVLIQPTLLIPGEEYAHLLEEVHNHSAGLTVMVGDPLLCSTEDLDRIIKILRETYPLPADSCLLLMGHGSRQNADQIYSQLDQRMRGTSMRLCTMEGTPTFTDGIRAVQDLGAENVILAPLLFCAGAHAREHLDPEKPDSLRNLLEQAGMRVTPVLRGLGELELIQKLYIEKARAAFHRLSGE